MAANSIKAAEYRRVFRDESITYRLAAATDPDRDPLIACQNSKHQLFIQKISVHVTTSAAQAITFQSGTTSVVVAVLPASASAGDEHVLIDLEEGFALPAGEDLNVDGAAGVAGLIHVQAYQRLAPGAVLLPSEI